MYIAYPKIVIACKKHAVSNEPPWKVQTFSISPLPSNKLPCQISKLTISPRGLNRGFTVCICNLPVCQYWDSRWIRFLLRPLNLVEKVWRNQWGQSHSKGFYQSKKCNFACLSKYSLFYNFLEFPGSNPQRGLPWQWSEGLAAEYWQVLWPYQSSCHQLDTSCYCSRQEKEITWRRER